MLISVSSKIAALAAITFEGVFSGQKRGPRLAGNAGLNGECHSVSPETAELR